MTSDSTLSRQGAASCTDGSEGYGYQEPSRAGEKTDREDGTIVFRVATSRERWFSLDREGLDRVVVGPCANPKMQLYGL